MKKMTALILTLVCLMGLAACGSKSMNYVIQNKPSVTGIVEEVHDGYILMYSDTAEGYPNGSNWSIALNAENEDSYMDFVVGDEIVVYHDGYVMETDPLQVGTVYAITLKTPAGQSDEIPSASIPGKASADEAFDFSVSYAGWIDVKEGFFCALNAEKMTISSVRHLPIRKFDTLDQFESFKAAYQLSDMERGHDEVPSFNAVTAHYDQKFFEENTLMLVYVGASSSSYRFGINSVYCDGTEFCIHVEQLNIPEETTNDEVGWLVTAAVPDSMVENCTKFDADLNNFN